MLSADMNVRTQTQTPEERKTRKKSKSYSSHKKQDLWKLFDREICNKEDAPITCIYRSSGERESCDNCKSSLAYTDEGFLACSNTACGVIYTDMIDCGAEWRFYGADDNQSSDPTRCGMPINPLLKESSYGCKIMCNGSSSYEMRKIKRYTEWQSMPYKEKSHYDEFQRITTMAQQGGIPKIIIDDAMIYHKKISEQKTFRGLNRDGIIAASIYISCRTNNNPRRPQEIAIMFHLDNTSATKGCKNAMTIINELEKDMEANERTVYCETNPRIFIERYCSRIHVSKELIKLCLFIAYQIEKHNYIPENTPHSIAAGILYFVCDLSHSNISKKDIHKITDISEVTINKCFKKLSALKEKIVPQVMLQKYNQS